MAFKNWEIFFLYFSCFATKRIIKQQIADFIFKSYIQLIQFVSVIKYGKTSSKCSDEEWCPSPFEDTLNK